MNRPLFFAAVVLLSCRLSPAFAQSELLFSDIAEDVGIIHSHELTIDCYERLATGSAWADVDNDSDIDLYVTSHGGSNRLYLNAGSGYPSFTEAIGYGIGLTDSISNGAVFIDYDNDGDQDLYVTNLYGNTLFANQLIESGSLGFLDVTAVAGIGDGGRGVTPSWGDFDQDGYLDLYIPKHKKCRGEFDSQDHLFRNNGDGTFEDVCRYLCEGASNCDQLEGFGFAAGWLDYDNDGDPDLYVVNDNIGKNGYRNVLWRNEGSDGAGGWRFRDVSTPSGAGINIHSMGLGTADYNNDGWFDYAISDVGGRSLLMNHGDGTFSDQGEAAGINTPIGTTWGTVFFDYDNDQWEDLYFTNGSIGFDSEIRPNFMYENNLDGTFTDISYESGLDDSSHGRNASIVDIDADGFVDVLIADLYDRPQLFRNRSGDLGNTNHWLTITVQGSISNRDGIGTRLTLITPDSLAMMRETTSGPTHGGGDYRAGFFGMGTHDRGFLSIRWPGGIIQEIGSVKADQLLHLTEPWPASINVEIEDLYDPVPDSGAVFPMDLSLTNHSDDSVQQEFWISMRRPNGQVRNDYFGPRTVSLPADSTIERSVRIRIGPNAPPGEYWLIGYFGEYPDNFIAVDSIWFSKTGSAENQLSGAVTQTGPHEFFLGQNFPNPFNSISNFEFRLPAGRAGISDLSDVTLTIYDLLGQEIATIVSERLSPGSYTRQWDAAGLPSGLYFYRMQAGEFVETKKLLLLK